MAQQNWNTTNTSNHPSTNSSKSNVWKNKISRHNRINHSKLISILGIDTSHIYVNIFSSSHNEPLKGIIKDLSKTWMKIITNKKLKIWDRLELTFMFNDRLIHVEDAEVRWVEKESMHITVWIKFNKIEDDWKTPNIWDYLWNMAKLNFIMTNSNKSTVVERKKALKDELSETFIDEVTIMNDIKERVAHIFSNKEKANTSNAPETLVMFLYEKAKISSNRVSMWITFKLPEDDDKLISTIKAVYTFLESLNIELINIESKNSVSDFIIRFKYALLDQREEIELWENLLDGENKRKVYLRKEKTTKWRDKVTIVIQWIVQEDQTIVNYIQNFDTQSSVPKKELKHLSIDDISQLPSVRKWDTILWFEWFTPWKEWIDCFWFTIPPKKIKQTPEIELKWNISRHEVNLNWKKYIEFRAESDWILLCKVRRNTAIITNIWVNEKMYLKTIRTQEEWELKVIESNTAIIADSMSWEFKIIWTWDIELTDNFAWKIDMKWNFSAQTVDNNSRVEAEWQIKILEKIWEKVVISSKDKVSLPTWVFSELTASWKEIIWDSIEVVGTTIIEWNNIRLTEFKANWKVIVKLGLWNILVRREELLKKVKQADGVFKKDIENKIDFLIKNIVSLLENKLPKEQYIEDVAKIKQLIREWKKDEACDIYDLILGRLPFKDRWNMTLVQYSQPNPKDKKTLTIPIIAEEASISLKKLDKKDEAEKELTEIEKIIDEWLSFKIDWVLAPNAQIEIRYWTNKSRMITSMPTRDIEIRAKYLFNKETGELKQERWKFSEE